MEIDYYKIIMVMVMVDMMALEWMDQQTMGELVEQKCDKVLVVEVVGIIAFFA